MRAKKAAKAEGSLKKSHKKQLIIATEKEPFKKING